MRELGDVEDCHAVAVFLHKTTIGYLLRQILCTNRWANLLQSYGTLMVFADLPQGGHMASLLGENVKRN